MARPVGGDFEVRILVTELRARGRIRHEFNKHLHRRYNEEGIVIPFPIRTIIMKGASSE